MKTQSTKRCSDQWLPFTYLACGLSPTVTRPVSLDLRVFDPTCPLPNPFCFSNGCPLVKPAGGSWFQLSSNGTTCATVNKAEGVRTFCHQVPEACREQTSAQRL